jgi:hypothetical protein
MITGFPPARPSRPSQENEDACPRLDTNAALRRSAAPAQRGAADWCAYFSPACPHAPSAAAHVPPDRLETNCGADTASACAAIGGGTEDVQCVAGDGEDVRRSADERGGRRICGAPYGQRSDERTNHRNGYRPREWDARAGTVDLAIPKLRRGVDGDPLTDSTQPVPTAIAARINPDPLGDPLLYHQAGPGPTAPPPRPCRDVK